MEEPEKKQEPVKKVVKKTKKGGKQKEDELPSFRIERGQFIISFK